MRIAVVNSKFASPKLGGGITSLLTLLEGIHRDRSIVVDAFQTSPTAEIDSNFEYNIQSYELPSVPLFHWSSRELAARRWEELLSNEIDSTYDIVIGQDRLGLAAVNAAVELGVPSLLFVRSLISTGYYQYHPSLSHVRNLRRADIGGKLQYPFVLQNYRRYRRAIRGADAVIANSDFTASKLVVLFGASPSVIYPPITVKKYKTYYNKEGDIMMVNPRTEQKGGDIFLRVAEMMPDEEFRLVGPAPASVQKKACSLSNVIYVEWTDDMKTQYGKSKVVVVPTQRDEPFGRVAAEAMTSGIPCVVSNKGGLPEVVGNTGYIVDEVDCVEEWYSTIRRAADDGYDKNRVERVDRMFSTPVQVDRIKKITNKLLI